LVVATKKKNIQTLYEKASKFAVDEIKRKE